MTQSALSSTATSWAHFRFAIMGPHYLTVPARSNQDRHRLPWPKTWSHPITGRDVRFSAVTIERWYYEARRGNNPVGVLRRAVREDCGKVALDAALAERLRAQYRDHPHWSFQLH